MVHPRELTAAITMHRNTSVLDQGDRNTIRPNSYASTAVVSYIHSYFAELVICATIVVKLLKNKYVEHIDYHCITFKYLFIPDYLYYNLCRYTIYTVMSRRLVK